MTLDEVVAFCLAKPGAQETYPFGDGELAAKVGDKVFAFVLLGEPGSVGVKCGRNADDAAEWRERYPEAITVSAYTGRYGWNSVALGAGVPDDDLRELIDGSYAAIVAKLPRSRRP